jgi:hypothetical protein
MRIAGLPKQQASALFGPAGRCSTSHSRAVQPGFQQAGICRIDKLCRRSPRVPPGRVFRCLLPEPPPHMLINHRPGRQIVGDTTTDGHSLDSKGMQLITGLCPLPSKQAFPASLKPAPSVPVIAAEDT